MSYRYAIELVVNDPETIDQRFEKLYLYVLANYQGLNGTLSDFYATGDVGIRLTQMVEENRGMAVRPDILKPFFEEDGQIIEMNFELGNAGFKIQFIVRDGSHFDLLSNDSQILKIAGKFNDLDLAHFNY